MKERLFAHHTETACGALGGWMLDPEAVPPVANWLQPDKFSDLEEGSHDVDSLLRSCSGESHLFSCSFQLWHSQRNADCTNTVISSARAPPVEKTNWIIYKVMRNQIDKKGGEQTIETNGR